MSPPTSDIVIVLPDLRLGGAQRVMLTVARQFASMGYGTAIVTLTKDGTLLDELPSDVRYRSLGFDNASLLTAGRALLKLVRYLREQKPRAILSTMTGTNLLTTAAYDWARVASRLVLREAVSTQNIKSRVMRHLLRHQYSRADAVVAVSQGVADDLAKLRIRRSFMHVIPNPVDSVRLSQLASCEPGIQLPTQPFIISVGRLTAQKDYETLIRAYALTKLRKSHLLLIVGDGEEREKLNGLVRNLGLERSVLFTGALLNPYPLIARSNLFVLSSRWEGYPNVILEALALKVPVIATDCPHGPREALQEGALGRLSPIGDASALARAMDAELETPRRSDERLGTYGCAAIAKKYLSVLLPEEERRNA